MYKVIRYAPNRNAAAERMRRETQQATIRLQPIVTTQIRLQVRPETYSLLSQGQQQSQQVQQ